MPRQSWVCVVFLTYKPSPFSSFTGKITARLFWNVWTGTAYFTLLLIFDRCSGEAHIHINWSHMHSAHMPLHYTCILLCTDNKRKTFCSDNRTHTFDSYVLFDTIDEDHEIILLISVQNIKFSLEDYINTRQKKKSVTFVMLGKMLTVLTSRWELDKKIERPATFSVMSFLYSKQDETC